MSRRGPSNTRGRLLLQRAHAASQDRCRVRSRGTLRPAPRIWTFGDWGIAVYFPDRQEGPWVRDIVWRHLISRERGGNEFAEGCQRANPPGRRGRWAGGYEAIAISMRPPGVEGPGQSPTANEAMNATAVAGPSR